MMKTQRLLAVILCIALLVSGVYVGAAAVRVPLNGIESATDPANPSEPSTDDRVYEIKFSYVDEYLKATLVAKNCVGLEADKVTINYDPSVLTIENEEFVGYGRDAERMSYLENNYIWGLPNATSGQVVFGFAFSESLPSLAVFGDEVEEEAFELLDIVFTIADERNVDKTHLTIDNSEAGISGGRYAVSNKCGDNLTWTLDDEGTLTISGTGDMHDYDWGKSPFYNDSRIKNVVIEKGVTSICDVAFYECSSLMSVNIPDSVESIGEYAFSKCYLLASIDIPESVTRISSWAFYDCISLASICIPDSVIKMGESVFWGCTSLESASIGDNVIAIANTVFYDCSSLTAVTIGGSVLYIDERAFEYCSSLTSISIPISVTSIGDRAFYGCENLTDVYYAGSEDDWNNIFIGSVNYCLYNATIHFKPSEHTHTWDNGVVTKSATCAETGIKTYTCTVCSETTTEIIPKTNNHTWDSGVVTKQPTTVSEGVKTYTCTVCKATKTESIPKLPQTVIDTATVKEKDGSVYAAPELTAADVIKAAGTGAKILKADGTQLKETEKVGSGMTLVKADGTKETIIVKGDTDGNGEISTSDARFALRAAVGLENPNGWKQNASDVDGEAGISTSDARLILRCAVGLETLKLY